MHAEDRVLILFHNLNLNQSGKGLRLRARLRRLPAEDRPEARPVETIYGTIRPRLQRSTNRCQDDIIDFQRCSASTLSALIGRTC